MNPPSGVLPVDKPEGPTSHDIVAAARRALGVRRIGHTGTLDPFASGLLLLCIGSATRLAEYLAGLPKRYTATLRLGATTTTDDLEGEIVTETEAWRSLSAERVEKAVGRQRGERLQVPPKFSAKRVGGERLYAIARAGGEVDPEPVRVTILAIDATRIELPEVDLQVEVSSGTYIRAIGRDIGDDLGVGGHLTRLRRTRVGDHDIRDAIAVSELGDPEKVARALLTPAEAVAHLPSVRLDDSDLVEIKHGRPLRREITEEGATVALIGPAGELLAIGESSGGMVRPRKVFS